MSTDSSHFHDVVDSPSLPPNNNMARLVVLAAIGLIFVFDSVFVAGVNGFILYLPAIWLAFRSGKSSDIYITAGLCSFLLIVDLYVSGAEEVVWIAVVNRILGISAIWMTAALCSQILNAQRKLAGRDRYRSSIIETALDAVISIDRRGRIVDWNAQAEKIFGWTRQEVVGEELARRIIPPEHRSAHRKGLVRYLRTGTGSVLGRRLELTALRKNGQEFPIELSVVAVQLEDRVLFNAFLRDITQRNEDARYRARLAALVDSSYDAIIGRDVTGTITSWNLGAERIYGYSEEEALGQTASLILPPDAESEEREILQAIQTGRRLEQFETVRQCKDGRLIPVSVTVSPIEDEQGTVLGSSTIERDFTERKRRQQELLLAKEDAERANRTRAEFLANVSHELRTPMNAIIGMTQLAMGEDLSDDVRDYVQTANESAHSLLTLLNDILDFSKIEAGKFKIESQPFSLRAMFHEALKPLSLRAFEKDLELACDISADVPDELVGDTVRIKQVLTNLIGNAIKFTDTGEVVVAVKLVKKWPHEVRLRFSVRDTGVGIAPEDQRRILEPFTQADASSTRSHGGTGLGLAISNDLVRLMGGRLSVKSELGKGSLLSFQISLPIQSGVGGQPRHARSLQQLRGLPVLVVDDNETNLRIVAENLKNWSMQPVTAQNGEEALDRIDYACESGSPFPLVIIDALMPEMDGYTLSQRICDRADHPPPMILMVSSSDRREFKERESDAAISMYLQKPITQSDLLDAVLMTMNIEYATLPNAQEDEDDEQASPDNRPLSILLAEDTPANQKVVTSILKKSGHRVTIAADGRQAVSLYRAQNFDLILMDIQMPVMDGFEATAAIRAEQKDSLAATPIIAMTAHAMRGDREKCLAAGMDAYIAKPVDVDELLTLVGTATDGRAELRAATNPTSNTLSSHDGNGDSAVGTAATPSASFTPAHKILDFEGAMQRLNGDMGLFKDFVRYFEEDSPTLLATLRAATRSADAAQVAQAAHSLKGLAANFGGERCVSIAGELERRGKAGDLEGSDALVTQLEDAVSQLSAALADHSN